MAASFANGHGLSNATSRSDESQAQQDSNTKRNPNDNAYRVHGVHLKQFEKVMAKILPKVQPHYVSLPPSAHAATSLDDSEDEDDWPFSTLPNAARVYGNNPGQLKDPKRAWRKEGQLRSMLRCILPLVPDRSPRGTDAHPSWDDDCTTIVDFGGGSGHLAIPLALMLPTCRVIVVDFNKRSLDLLHSKAALVTREVISTSHLDQQNRFFSLPPHSVPQSIRDNPLFKSCGTTKEGILSNLFTFRGPLEQFTEPFDMALALHLCGEATDVGLRKAAAIHSAAIVVAPCCVGKLSQKASNPDVFNATGQNVSNVSYPQSSLLCQLITQQDDWDALAKAADYSNEQECGTSRNATRRAAKALLETDRRMFLEEQYGYKTALLRMQPFSVTPKNDILVAWRPEVYGDHRATELQDLFSNSDTQCQAEIEVANSHLLSVEPACDSVRNNTVDAYTASEYNDWTQDEEEGVKQTIMAFLDGTKDMEDAMDQKLIFPTKMGGRKRKLIHFVAGRFNLAHWCQGLKDGERTVVVARRGQRQWKEPST